MGTRDPNPKRPVTVESVPSSATAVTTASVLVSAGTYQVFEVITIPNQKQLNLWNFLWNIYIDVNDVAHDYFAGTAWANNALTILNMEVTENLNWAHSSDTQNIRSHRIMVKNNDSVDHTAYLKYKAYTFVGVG